MSNFYNGSLCIPKNSPAPGRNCPWMTKNLQELTTSNEKENSTGLKECTRIYNKINSAQNKIVAQLYTAKLLILNWQSRI